MKVYKAYHGWVAKSDHVIEGNRILKLLTMKHNNGQLITTATAIIREGNVEHLKVFRDYYKAVVKTDCKRVTQKAVEEQHKTVDVDALMVEVKNFYQIA
jgi:hypothetical protein